MTTAAQNHANLQNAQKSTGPKTEEGKKRSRLNATKHGLSGDPSRFKERELEAFEERYASWIDGYILSTDEEHWAYENLIIASLQIDQCREAARAARAEHVSEAANNWEEARRLDALNVAKGFAKDPEITAAKLQMNKHGCELMIRRWEGLLEALRLAGDWTDEMKTAALDLLGVARAFRGNHRILRLGEVDADREHFGERETLAETELKRLREAVDSKHDTLDDIRRGNAENGCFTKTPRQLAAILRYEKDAIRRFEQFRALLRRRPVLDSPTTEEVVSDNSDDVDLSCLTSRPDSIPDLVRQLSRSKDGGAALYVRLFNKALGELKLADPDVDGPGVAPSAVEALVEERMLEIVGRRFDEIEAP